MYVTHTCSQAFVCTGNYPLHLLASSDSGRVLSVGAICFQGRFYASKKVEWGEVGGHIEDMPRHWLNHFSLC